MDDMRLRIGFADGREFTRIHSRRVREEAAMRKTSPQPKEEVPVLAYGRRVMVRRPFHPDPKRGLVKQGAGLTPRRLA